MVPPPSRCFGSQPVRSKKPGSLEKAIKATHTSSARFKRWKCLAAAACCLGLGRSGFHRKKFPAPIFGERKSTTKKWGNFLKRLPRKNMWWNFSWWKVCGAWKSCNRQERTRKIRTRFDWHYLKPWWSYHHLVMCFFFNFPIFTTSFFPFPKRWGCVSSVFSLRAPLPSSRRQQILLQLCHRFVAIGFSILHQPGFLQLENAIGRGVRPWNSRKNSVPSCKNDVPWN